MIVSLVSDLFLSYLRKKIMLGLNDIQYLYEFLFWVILYLSLRKVWHRNQVRVLYAYSVATLNFVAVLFFIYASIFGNLNSLNAIAFGFLHAMVGIVLVTTMKVNKKFDNKPIDIKVEADTKEKVLKNKIDKNV